MTVMQFTENFLLWKEITAII